MFGVSIIIFDLYITQVLLVIKQLVKNIAFLLAIRQINRRILVRTTPNKVLFILL